MRKTMALLLVLATGFGCGKKRPEIKSTPIDPESTASISGTVFFEGEIKSEPPIQMAGGAECQSMHKGAVYHQRILAAHGRLQNAFVYIKSGLEKFVFAPPNEPVVIDQQRCMFVPRVSGAMVWQPIELRNSDPVNHNVSNEYWNAGLPIQGAKSTQYFESTKVPIPLKCNVHDWMIAYIGVVPHPFYKVTGEDGTFTFKGVPEGEYELEAWHESLGRLTARVSLKRKADQTGVEFRFSSK